jgi:hypothetical protein
MEAKIEMRKKEIKTLEKEWVWRIECEKKKEGGKEKKRKKRES